MRRSNVTVEVISENHLSKLERLLCAYDEDIATDPLDFQFIESESNYLVWVNHSWMVVDASESENRLTLEGFEEFLLMVNS